MKNFLSFILSFCVVLAVVGGLGIIFPNGKMSKSVRYISVLALICSFLTLFCCGFNMNISNNISFDFEDFSPDSTAFSKLIFENALKSNNIDYRKISLITDKTDNGSIIITKIIVYSNESVEKIKKAIGNDAEYEVEVINE